jgi:hypothetical protein
MGQFLHGCTESVQRRGIEFNHYGWLAASDYFRTAAKHLKLVTLNINL